MRERATATLTTVVVDDEQLACDELSYLLKDFPEVEVIATGSNGLEAVDLIQKLEPELVFLDVHMPGLDGIGVVRRLRESGVGPAALHFRHRLRPVRRGGLPPGGDGLPAEAGGQATAWPRPSSVPAAPSRTRKAPEAAPAQGAPGHAARTKLLVRANNRNFIVDANDVIYATIDNGLITLVTTNLEGQSNYRTIEDLQANLDREMFWRVHRSYLVNINRIKEVVPWFKSSYQLRMDDKQAHRNPGEPRADPAPARTVQTLTLRTGQREGNSPSGRAPTRPRQQSPVTAGCRRGSGSDVMGRLYVAACPTFPYPGTPIRTWCAVQERPSEAHFRDVNRLFAYTEST